jgi:AcrR family transcriptional regulator
LTSRPYPVFSRFNHIIDRSFYETSVFVSSCRSAFHGWPLATSIQQVGEAAGVARSTPSYFSRSKETLYEAALAHAIRRAVETLAAARAEYAEDRSPEAEVETLIQVSPLDRRDAGRLLGDVPIEPFHHAAVSGRGRYTVVT